MPTLQSILQRYPQTVVPHVLSDIPQDRELVYGLIVNDVAVICGRGKRIRARVIFDNLQSDPTVHLKAMTVRLHRLYGPAGQVVERFFIPCANKAQARQVERELHGEIGGNRPNIPPEIHERLLTGLASDSPVALLLRAALVSAYDGLSDLRRWREAGIVDDVSWMEIGRRLSL